MFNAVLVEHAREPGYSCWWFAGFCNRGINKNYQDRRLNYFIVLTLEKVSNFTIQSDGKRAKGLMGKVYLTSAMNKVIMPQDIYELLRPDQSFLSRVDMQMRTADSNSQMLAMHRAERADLIIAYLDTEETSGEELCRKIRADVGTRGVSILLICRAQESEIGRCINCNANAYVTMPIVSAIVLQEAYRLLNIAPRKTCRVPVKIRLVCTARGKRFTGMLEDISTAGLFFRSSGVIPEGATVHCTFAVAGSRQLTVPGEVVRVLPDELQAGYGVSFFDISTEAVSAIGRFSGEENAADVRDRQQPCSDRQNSEL